jgi:hypothetical protein
VADIAAQFFKIVTDAVHQVDAQCDGPQIEVLALKHFQCGYDFSTCQHMVPLPRSAKAYPVLGAVNVMGPAGVVKCGSGS